MVLKLVEDDPQVILSNILSKHEEITKRKMQPSDPEYLNLSALAAIIVQERVQINATFSQNMLRYARQNVLDEFGLNNRTPRLPAEPARTTLRFTLSAPQTSAIIIPAGTRVTPDGSGGEIYFTTESVLQISIGSISGDVGAVCSVSGTSGNGFIPGQINALMDPIAFIQSTVNVTESSGGADEEKDDAYRGRIRSAPESYSVAGPDGAYEYWAKTASAAIIDVSVESPAPVEILLTPLLVGGELPTQDLLDAVYDAVSARDVRPLTDLVSVQAPQVVTYNIGLTYYIAVERATEAATIQEAVNDAVNSFVTWQKSKLGRGINPSELISRVMAAGAQRVAVTEPIFTELNRTQVAREGAVNLVFGGLADE
ncbi:baseplate J/gp47 family protein [Paenibacillus sp. E222]|uniref:baseplate assembly protein n=1 Tax=Paenibacillus sp. E222 TaxID=2748863 RepID=UPI0015C68C07|nr:baseplate J/gp47 family protein [Paenibacillus sp. E222]QLG39402.1 baseplate J/gp47 family protein [Paenibacillus sp. E222]